ncbi:unnamed protein product [Urochloa decumbens]|uniref:Uncharacterized protein n=1 Tax=Urochloa decumbens TaxID=240449 RepID=A0ABC8YC43_9POAL
MAARRFTMSFMTVGRAGTRPVPPPPTVPPVSRVRQILDEHRPWEALDNMALIIMHQTYAALVEILGPQAPRSATDGHVHISRPVDPADPASPLLAVNASATHCCISLIDGAASAKHESKPQQYRLRRVTITASPGALHIARVAGGGGHWTCADVWPDVASRGLFGVLEAIKARVGAAIRLEESMLRMARDSGCQQQSPMVREIAEVRTALEEMSAAVDIDAIMRERRRRPLIQEEIACRPDVDPVFGDAEAALAERLSSLHVGKKRAVQEISCRQVDDSEVLVKRTRTLHV